MVDPERVALMLQRLRGEVAYLRRRADSDRAALRADEERMSGLKYRFITALETVINIAQHLCASEGWGPPASNADCVRLLGANGVLEDGLADRVASAVGFRNLLVHQYGDIDDDLVVDNLDDLEDLEGFVQRVAAWTLETGPGWPSDT